MDHQQIGSPERKKSTLPETDSDSSSPSLSPNKPEGDNLQSPWREKRHPESRISLLHERNDLSSTVIAQGASKAGKKVEAVYTATREIQTLDKPATSDVGHPLLLVSGKNSRRSTSPLKLPRKRGIPHVYRDFSNVPDTAGYVRKKTGGVTQPFPEKVSSVAG